MHHFLQMCRFLCGYLSILHYWTPAWYENLCRTGMFSSFYWLQWELVQHALSNKMHVNLIRLKIRIDQLAVAIKGLFQKTQHLYFPTNHQTENSLALHATSSPWFLGLQMQENLTSPFSSNAFCTSIETQHQDGKEKKHHHFWKRYTSSSFSSALWIIQDVTKIHFSYWKRRLRCKFGLWRQSLNWETITFKILAIES